MLTLTDDGYLKQGEEIVGYIGLYNNDKFYDIQKIINNSGSAYDAVNEFCERVESGEFRSVKTYGRFLQILIDAGYRE